MPAPRPRGPQTRSQQILAVAPVAVDSRQSASTYYRKAKLLLTQADAYRATGNTEQLFAMLARYAVLVVEQLPKVRGYNGSDPAYKEHRHLLKTRYMPELEALGLKINKSYNEDTLWETKLLPNTVPLSASNLDEINWENPAQPGTQRRSDAATPRSAAAAATTNGLAATAALVSGMAGVSALASSVVPSAPPMPPSSSPNSDLAKLSSLGADLSSFRLRPASKEAMSRHAVLASDLASVPSLPLDDPHLTRTGSKSMYPVFEQPVVQQEGAPSLMDAPPVPGINGQSPPQPIGDGGSWPAGQLPGQLPGQAQDWNRDQQQVRPGWPGQDTVQVVIPPTAKGNSNVSELLALSTVPPSLQLGPQQVATHTMSAVPGGPCGTCSEIPAPPPSAPGTDATSQALVASNGVKPLQKRKALRDVHVSMSLMEDFLRYAAANTNRGIESCGILAGTLSADDSIFLITTLIIPKQEGTSDTVQALNEEEVFEVQDSRALYPLGWIHTHPTQTCFLSSIDVHTQCGYQTMLEEAVAIVMAPRDRSNRCGMFRLTTPGGLKVVQKCTLRGFHTHPGTETGQEIYELVGHVYLNSRAQHDIVDLR